MNHNPLVSVIVTTYNRKEFLKETIDSILNQTFKDFELIVVDNFSNYDFFKLIKSFNDDRIKPFQNQNNGIIAVNRNYGIKIARGKYIAFCDDDDLWYQEKLDVCITTLQNRRYNAVCHGEYWLHSTDNKTAVFYGPESRANFQALLHKGNCISTSAVVVNKSALLEVGCFSENSLLITAEDYDLWLKLARAGYRFAIINDILGEYRVHSGSNVNYINTHTIAVLSVLRIHLDMEESTNVLKQLKQRKTIGRILRSGGRVMQMQNQKMKAWKYYLKSAIQYPFSLKLLILTAMLFLPSKIVNSIIKSLRV